MLKQMTEVKGEQFVQEMNEQKDEDYSAEEDNQIDIFSRKRDHL